MKQAYRKPETTILTVNMTQMVCASLTGMRPTLVDDPIEDNDQVLSRRRTVWDDESEDEEFEEYEE